MGQPRLTQMQGNRYLASLATVLHGSAVPYGYTVTVWTSGMMLTRQRGLPSVGQIFLFMAGATAAFTVLGLVVSVTRGAPFEPSPGALRRTGMVQVLAVGCALGAAALIALIHNGVAWPLGAFVATAAYFTLTTLELTLAGRG